MKRSFSSKKIDSFRRTIWGHYRRQGRDFPWRRTRDPYKILVSEIMLQQTQVSRVLKKYPEFIRAFPDFRALSQAPFSHVLRVWQGMGYNRRALALKRIAAIVVGRFHGKLPDDPTVLAGFPGIGKATAGSIVAFAFDKPTVFIETNIRRVFIHHFFPKRESVDDKEILPFVEAALERDRPREWYWALMDYGAYLATTIENPNRRSSSYRKQSSFEGSNRQLRGMILKLLASRPMESSQLCKRLHGSSEQIKSNLKTLEHEGFIVRKRLTYHLCV
ncbi:MAG: A/G-specific adenine glycosylase [Parcubacteria group bacterium]|nr:A/G-specific adenine glycosylase [Parcubacteria group bacterium]